ncbi:orotidine 5'-phosphate decarboxylase, partial [mine drainage metagenome]
RDWNMHGNCALVVGATYPDELAQVRALVGDMPLLVPGVGAQGGDAEAVVTRGCSSAGTGLMVSASRAVLYASSGDDYAVAARAAAQQLRTTLGAARRKIQAAAGR